MPRATNPQKQAEWRRRLRRFSRSNLSVVEFCRREEVSTPSFYHWRRKLAAASSDGRPQVEMTRDSFVPVQVATSSDLQAVFPNGARVSLPVHDRDLLRLSIETIAMAQANQGGA